MIILNRILSLIEFKNEDATMSRHDGTKEGRLINPTVTSQEKFQEIKQNKLDSVITVAASISMLLILVFPTKCKPYLGILVNWAEHI